MAMIFNAMHVSFHLKTVLMRRIAALFVILSILIISACTKGTVKIPVSYSVETENSATGIVEDVYVPQTGTYHMHIAVKFLEGNNRDSVTVRLSGLPTTIMSNMDSMKAQPTYIADFALTTNGAPLTDYTATISSTAPGTTPKTYTLHIHIVPADCSAYVSGNYSGSNACTARNYTYNVNVATTSQANTVAITNFGGYNSTGITYATINCNHDSLYINSQTVDGVTIQGQGTFTGTGMTIWYTANNVPTGGDETCVATFTRQ
jgi:hypothetical protein